VLAAWAPFISLAIGMRKASLIENLGQQRAVMAVSAVLVLFAMAIVGCGGNTSTTASVSSAVPVTGATTGTAQTAPSSATQRTATTGAPPAPSSPAAASKLRVIADPAGRLRYTTAALTAKAGRVTIVFENASPVKHDVTIGQGFKALGATPTFAGGKKALTLRVAPGTYAFWCSIPGHRAAGMEGVLTVSG
jgi:plastocyanin